MLTKSLKRWSKIEISIWDSHTCNFYILINSPIGKIPPWCSWSMNGGDQSSLWGCLCQPFWLSSSSQAACQPLTTSLSHCQLPGQPDKQEYGKKYIYMYLRLHQVEDTIKGYTAHILSQMREREREKYMNKGGWEGGRIPIRGCSTTQPTIHLLTPTHTMYMHRQTNP